ncbi:STAS-like domain-containing protein [Nodosilinea nodulosa]|uniref:STAS-like domain-containing protein n=1 Tax=Nodosilinea nodulosa TaxID=416001 RepID=UPI00030CA8C2|nr:STAS-like domain-containing protein [Nodosilinea nodulosa]
MIFKIHDITGQYAISADHGQQVYDHIHGDLLDGRSVELDFAEVNVFASAFFNFAIGQLLKDISTDDLNQLLTISNLNPSGDSILRHIITSAQRYYSDRQYQAAADAVMEEYADSFEA